VLSFLTLRELAVALSVSQVWSVAVLSMRPAMLTATISDASLWGLLSSRLRRHVGQIGQSVNRTLSLRIRSSQLAALSHACPPPQSGPAASAIATAANRQPATDGFSAFPLPTSAATTNSGAAVLPVFDFSSSKPISLF
jgi:hypothetical protein